MPAGASILGCEGPRLTADERRFFAKADPWGFILFARNVEDPVQLSALTAELRECVGRDAPILVDQEGGRVARLRGPHWREFLPALEQIKAVDPELGSGAVERSVWLRSALIADDLASVGIDVNCAPLADLVRPETHSVLHNRLYGGNIETVVRLCRAAREGMAQGGVLSVLKHLPGYGRATVDSHHEPARVSAPLEALEAHDFAPFRMLTDFGMGMTAHVIVEALDKTAPATTSRVVMDYIRDEIGFGGLLMTDDIGMEALSGTIYERSAAAIAAGCDVVLHCKGDMAGMEQAVDAAGRLSEKGQERAEYALYERREPAQLDTAALEDELQGLIG
ncbi:beta-hexosaminidase [Brevirhabdus pacifica]|uniref:beta-N-acetylhexosaminidase n=1 Tax=Brevirhabdus pacifica TaxID=1267768 RepID=A0A1U7DF30_9RHOB|nr:glycoside hydrolase family 3 N-terminal domain-containing protein [Brevirhabdus pacifica]APX88488.1 beta-hexosaminidase [Brevirhabdus pacifica]OWU79792.1 beta-hexosaminidase [Loktanella sp. 22II-4b]PJJ87036.1 beta-N-acetylhexosaminidase [Brevirhabdus pacifica]